MFLFHSKPIKISKEGKKRREKGKSEGVEKRATLDVNKIEQKSITAYPKLELLRPKPRLKRKLDSNSS